MESIRVQLEEESEARLDLERQLVKANGEAQHWRSKFEAEAAARSEEIEEIRRKYSIRIQEQEEQIETLIVKINNVEKQKSRLQSEVCCYSEIILVYFHIAEKLTYFFKDKFPSLFILVFFVFLIWLQLNIIKQQTLSFTS